MYCMSIVCLCMYCMYVYIYVCMHMYAYVCMYVCVCMYVYVYVMYVMYVTYACYVCMLRMYVCSPKLTNYTIGAMRSSSFVFVNRKMERILQAPKEIK